MNKIDVLALLIKTLIKLRDVLLFIAIFLITFLIIL